MAETFDGKRAAIFPSMLCKHRTLPVDFSFWHATRPAAVAPHENDLPLFEYPLTHASGVEESNPTPQPSVVLVCTFHDASGHAVVTTVAGLAAFAEVECGVVLEDVEPPATALCEAGDVAGRGAADVAVADVGLGEVLVATGVDVEDGDDALELVEDGDGEEDVELVTIVDGGVLGPASVLSELPHALSASRSRGLRRRVVGRRAGIGVSS